MMSDQSREIETSDLLPRDGLDRAYGPRLRTFDDCDQIGDMTRREGDAEFTQLSAGPFRGSTRYVELGDLRVYHARMGGWTLAHSLTREAYLYYHVPIDARSLTWEGQEISRPVLIQHAGQDELVRHAHDMDVVVIVAPRERVMKDARGLAGATDRCDSLPRGILEPSNAAARELMNVALEFARASSGRPSCLEAPGYLEILHERLERSLIELVVGQIGVRDERLPAPGSRQKTVLRAIACMDEAASRRVTVPELCRTLGVSRRTLEYAFLTICGATPYRYMQIRRLRTARKALRESNRECGAVKRAAYDAGFTALGRFSVEYRRFFGESPNETLSRC